MPENADDQLNEKLDARCLLIFVPWGCHVMGFGTITKDNWVKYVDTLPPNKPVPSCRSRVPEKCKHCCSHKGRKKNCLKGMRRWEIGKTNDYGGFLIGDKAIAHAQSVHRMLFRQVLRFPGINAVDIGFAVEEELRQFENVLAIRFHLEQKFSETELRARGLPDLTSLCYAPKKCRHCMPKKRAKRMKRMLKEKPRSYDRYPIPGIEKTDLSIWCNRLAICGVPVDVIDATYFPTASIESPGVFVGPLEPSYKLTDDEALLTGQQRVNILAGGVSIGSDTGQAGTLGTVVWDETDGSPCILSNWHVMAGSTDATVGQPITQPARFDGGSDADIVAHLKRWHLGEEGDAALAELTNERPYASAEILGIWSTIAGYQQPTLNLEVSKWGRTTGFTDGFIDGVNLAINLDYGNGIVRHFTNQIHIAPLRSGEDFSQVGDSGSLVIAPVKPDSLKASQDFLEYLLEDKNLKKTLRKWLKSNGILDDKKFDSSALSSGTLREVIQRHWAEKHPPLPDSVLQREEDVLLSIKTLGDLKGADEILNDFVMKILKEKGFDLGAQLAAKKDEENRAIWRIYTAVGLLFAGDTPGSPFGEFALASDIQRLADQLGFCLRPVFEPRSSFRELREVSRSNSSAGVGGGRSIGPRGRRSDSRGGGPQPDPEPSVRDRNNNEGGN